MKFCYAPNATDEYVLSDTGQEGSVWAPYSTLLPVSGITGSGPGLNQCDWIWPEWDISSIAFYSTTDLDLRHAEDETLLQQVRQYAFGLGQCEPRRPHAGQRLQQRL
ncbi:hypothetical protein [Pseudogemmobacter bohemicus]|uniref:hypothetical protein n=1 Tax=Pseudogemmobacter bohemicus TaxID=2250708 RepID=UPI0013003EBA|nr:hypothetical protein [Pseudogemmobacter bohemicus]